VSADEDGTQELKEVGVRDSKKLSPHRRETLYAEILKISARVHWVAIPPDEIDTIVLTGRKYRKLNFLEGLYFARVIDELGASVVTVDASDSVPSRFKEVILSSLKTTCDVRAFHKADRDYPLVSAASIIARAMRSLIEPVGF